MAWVLCSKNHHRARQYVSSPSSSQLATCKQQHHAHTHRSNVWLELARLVFSLRPPWVGPIPASRIDGTRARSRRGKNRSMGWQKKALAATTRRAGRTACWKNMGHLIFGSNLRSKGDLRKRRGGLRKSHLRKCHLRWRTSSWRTSKPAFNLQRQQVRSERVHRSRSAP